MPGSLKEPYAAVAVPLPIPRALDYLVSRALDSRAQPGVRVRVSVGRRKLTGVLLERHDRAPSSPEIKLKPLDAVIDLAPILPPDLVDLATLSASTIWRRSVRCTAPYCHLDWKRGEARGYG